MDMMTHDPKPSPKGSEIPRPSLLPFDPADLVALRVSPAKFARMCQVTKQTVSQWIKQGKVTLGPDGKLDPAKAAREVFERTDPSRLRARVFKDAMAGTGEMRTRIQALEEQLATLRAEMSWRLSDMEQITVYRCKDELARNLSAYIDVIVAKFPELCTAHRAGSLEDFLDVLSEEIFYVAAPADAAEAESNSENAPTE